MADVKWYYKPFAVIIALAVAGPFALPLVWKSPKFSKSAKSVLTLIVILITVWLVKFSADMYKALDKELRYLQEVMKQ